MTGRAARGSKVAGGLWALVLALAVLAGWRLQAVSWRQRPEGPARAVEDRREHRFRHFTYSQTQRLLDGLLRSAYATTGRERALALARVAALQRERGLDEPAAAAAREAQQLAGGDAAVRAILAGPLRLEDIEPTGGIR